MILFQPTKIKVSKIHGSNSYFVLTHTQKKFKIQFPEAKRLTGFSLYYNNPSYLSEGTFPVWSGVSKIEIFLITCPIILNSNCKNRQQRNFNWRTHATGYRTPAFCKLCKTVNPSNARFTF